VNQELTMSDAPPPPGPAFPAQPGNENPYQSPGANPYQSPGANPYQSSGANPYGGSSAGSSEQRVNILAVLSLVLAFFISIGAVICGHIALSQIKRTGEKGRGLAIAGLVLGYLGIVAGILLFLGFLALIPWMDINNMPMYGGI
jgi:hypothetical protein